VKWAAAVNKAGLPAGFHFDDLRHTGNNLAAAAGASTRELMHRMGQTSMRAALIYQHATSERDREIAEGMANRIAKTQGKKAARKNAAKRRGNGRDPDDGTAGVVARVS
jgi:integrase